MPREPRFLFELEDEPPVYDLLSWDLCGYGRRMMSSASPAQLCPRRRTATATAAATTTSQAIL